MQKILFIFLTIILLNSFLFAQNESNRNLRVILFNKIGQKEKININENVSVVYGSAIKPEYSYLSYSQGQSSNEYYIELKSNENLLKEIKSLRTSFDSISTADIKVEHKTNTIDETAQKANYNNAVKDYPAGKVSDDFYPLLDSLRIDAEQRDNLNIFSRIPRIKSSSANVSNVINDNIKAIETNEKEMGRNRTRIDDLMRAIDEAKKSGKNQDKLEEFYREIDSLRTRNIQIELLNIKLKNNNSLLSSDLRAKNAEYDSLLRLIYVISSLALLFIVISIFVYINYRQKTKFNKELNRINHKLEKINKSLDKSNNQKDKLLKIISKELDYASRYVISLFPKPITNGKINTDWIYIPSKELGGDAFGYSMIDEDTFAVYLLDVSGHGIGSALHSVQVLNILQNRTLPNVDFRNPDEVLNALNKIFQMNHYSGLYFTICYATYNFKSRKLKYSAAGHPPMLLICGKDIKTLESQHIFIGAVNTLDYCCEELEISKPTSLYMFSDGVFEFEKNATEMYTFPDFREHLYINLEQKKTALNFMYQNAKTICNKTELDDDFSILKINFR